MVGDYYKRTVYGKLTEEETDDVLYIRYRCLYLYKTVFIAS